MKLKCRPEDFQVEELTGFAATGGPFALYRLTKRALGTPEAIEAVRRRWKLSRKQISYGGLKDRHAVTSQFVTIKQGPRRDLVQSGLELVYQGQAAVPFGPQEIAGNRFRIVLRSLGPAAARAIVAGCEPVARDGVPNYFDEQRFGSLGRSGEFIAQPWCRGDYERALWLALAEPNPHDRSREKRQKALLREHWGDWPECRRRLAPSHRRSIVTYLVDHPRDFRRALALIRIDLRGLYVAAFQSRLWNRILAARISELCRDEQPLPLDVGGDELPCYRSLSEIQRAELDAPLPLPSARLNLAPGPLAELYERVAGEFGLSLRELRVKYPRDSFFSKGERAMTARPENLRVDLDDDELYAGAARVTLAFDLPRGAYATIVVKRLTATGAID